MNGDPRLPERLLRGGRVAGVLKSFNKYFLVNTFSSYD